MIRLSSQHDVAFPREVLWPVLSKTDWLNRSLGLPPVKYEIEARAEGGSWVTARARILRREMRWRELPFEWLEPEFYHVRRIYESGPFKEAVMGMELQARPDGGTRVIAFAELTPKNRVGKWLAQRLVGPKARWDMRRVMAHTEEFLRGRKPVVLPRLPKQPVNEGAMRTALQKLKGAEPAAGLAQRLEAWLRESPDVELGHIRPFAVARTWDCDRWEVLRLFLQATHCGLLDLRWELLCPNCRSSRQPPVNSLRQIKRAAHCEVCQIKFDAEFDKSVELKFAVNPAIRPPDAQTYCLAGPGGKPHIVGQLWLGPHEERSWKLPALTRALRLNSLQVKEPLRLRAEDLIEGKSLAITCDPGQFQMRHETGGGHGVAQVSNPNAFPVLLSLEHAEWDEDILTAARATNWQEFRDLFSSEVISPTEQVTVGAQVVLFTDLRGSTAMYHTLGDAAAYAIVRNHFAVLEQAIRAHRGTVVKTIGDAVMATFSRADEALTAVQQIHEKLPVANPTLCPELVLKSALHIGPCLAVNANDKLDYFGTTVNFAARMVECCQGGDLTVSDEFFLRPEMGVFLEGCARRPEASEVRFRGFEAPLRVWRIRMV